MRLHAGHLRRDGGHEHRRRIVGQAAGHVEAGDGQWHDLLPHHLTLRQRLPPRRRRLAPVVGAHVGGGELEGGAQGRSELREPALQLRRRHAHTSPADRPRRAAPCTRARPRRRERARPRRWRRPSPAPPPPAARSRAARRPSTSTSADHGSVFSVSSPTLPETIDERRQSSRRGALRAARPATRRALQAATCSRTTSSPWPCGRRCSSSTTPSAYPSAAMRPGRAQGQRLDLPPRRGEMAARHARITGRDARRADAPLAAPTRRRVHEPVAARPPDRGARRCRARARAADPCRRCRRGRRRTGRRRVRRRRAPAASSRRRQTTSAGLAAACSGAAGRPAAARSSSRSAGRRGALAGRGEPHARPPGPPRLEDVAPAARRAAAVGQIDPVRVAVVCIYAALSASRPRPAAPPQRQPARRSSAARAGSLETADEGQWGRRGRGSTPASSRAPAADGRGRWRSRPRGCPSRSGRAARRSARPRRWAARRRARRPRRRDRCSTRGPGRGRSRR